MGIIDPKKLFKKLFASFRNYIKVYYFSLILGIWGCYCLYRVRYGLPHYDALCDCFQWPSVCFERGWTAPTMHLMVIQVVGSARHLPLPLLPP